VASDFEEKGVFFAAQVIQNACATQVGCRCTSLGMQPPS
jgi:hypothetical protein